MPLIQVTVIENVFSEAQKQAMILKLTDAMVSIEGENLRSLTWVIIEEVKDGNLGIGENRCRAEALVISGGKKPRHRNDPAPGGITSSDAVATPRLHPQCER